MRSRRYRHGVCIALLLLVSASCADRPLAPGIVRLYSASPVPTAIISSSELDQALGALRKRKQGDVQALRYSRDTTAETYTRWKEVVNVRASSYAAALQLLRDREISRPLLVSASMVVGYLKYHNDLWYGALERALDQEIPFTASRRQELALRLIEDMKAAGVSTEALLHPLEQHRKVFTASAAELRDLWRGDAFKYKPLSFYSGDERLERIWTADRALLQIIDGIPATDLATLNAWWRQQDSEGRRALRSLRDVFAKVTNRFDPAIFSGDLLAVMHNTARASYACLRQACATLWPPSSPGVLERLPAGKRHAYDAEGRSQPHIDEIVAATKSGDLTLLPVEGEGFLIHQRYALESLVTFPRLPERAIVFPDPQILAIWEEVFKAGTTKALDTHAKVIDSGAAKAAALPPAEEQKPERLLLEPVPTLYLRYARSYGILLNWARTLPASFTAAWTVEGTGILSYLERLERETLGLYYLSIRQLGLAPDPAVRGQIEAYGQDQLFETGRRFLGELHTHPATSNDQRLFVVQERPGGPKGQHCAGKPGVFLVTVGVRPVPVVVNLALSGVRDPHGEPMVILVDHFEEITACIDQPLTRAEWRKLLSESRDSAEVTRRLAKNY